MTDFSQALCAQTDPELFFPDVGGDSAILVRNARRVCRECPVVVDCIEQAITDHEYGVWGGTTYQERSRIRAARLRGAA